MERNAHNGIEKKYSGWKSDCDYDSEWKCDSTKEKTLLSMYRIERGTNLHECVSENGK